MRTAEQLLKAGLMLCDTPTVKSAQNLTVPIRKYESKFDGTRGKGANLGNNQIEIIGRDRGNGQGTLYGTRGNLPELNKDMQRAPAQTVFDMEIIGRNEVGIVTFSISQTRCANHKAVPSIVEQNPITGMCFDILMLRGKEVWQLPYLGRKAILKEELSTGGYEHLEYSEHYDDGRELWKNVEQGYMEGVIAKVAASPYTFSRGPEWWKLKFQQDIIVDVVGYTAGKNAREGLFGALIVTKDGKHIGEVGPGHLERSESEKLTAFLNAQPKIPCPFLIDKPYQAIRTTLQADVTFHRLSKYGIMRFPVLNRTIYPQQVQLQDCPKPTTSPISPFSG
jgi:ATP-dependent DNA ligase